MNRFQTVERLDYSARQMFDLVAAVEDYEAFLPLCERSVVHERHEAADGHVVLLATLELVHKKTGIRDTFNSTVHLCRERLEIETIADTGPVKHLKSRWIFRDLDGGGSEAQFSVEYEMRSSLLKMLMGKLYQILFERIAGAFKERARAVYG